MQKQLLFDTQGKASQSDLNDQLKKNALFLIRPLKFSTSLSHQLKPDLLNPIKAFLKQKSTGQQCL